MDVKTLSSMIGHVSAATTLDIYTHITDAMRKEAAANIDRGIAKVQPQSGNKAQAKTESEKSKAVGFKPYQGKRRKAGTGCVYQINDNLWEGKYSPKWIDGKKRSRNVYANTREECEEKLKVLIAEMKAELAALKEASGS